MEHSKESFANPILQDLALLTLQSIVDSGKEAQLGLIQEIDRIFRARPFLAQQKHINLLIGLYGATTSLSDRVILALLKLLESTSTSSSISQIGLRLLLGWGSKVSVNSAKVVDANVITELIQTRFDGKLLLASISHYPLHTDFDAAAAAASAVYDPEFVLHWLYFIVIEFKQHSLVDIQVLFESGLVAFVICSLASYQDQVRTLAFLLLEEIEKLVKVSELS